MIKYFYDDDDDDDDECSTLFGFQSACEGLVDSQLFLLPDNY
ncbi:hypothetical protein [Clostridium estertheticum]|nr:hypothetical protein [Clostridium estertheticum]